MNEFKYGFRRFFKGGSLNIIKVISLGLGFAISFLLLAKVSHELSYDSFIQDSDRVYLIKATYTGKNRETLTGGWVQGPVAQGMKKEIPQVEAATRWTPLTENSKLYLEDKRAIHFKQAAIADKDFFSIITTKVISGNPQKILSEKMHCMISHELAAKIGGGVIGKSIELGEYPGVSLVVSGVYEALPSNSSYQMDILISMPTTDQFMYDNSENWLGNDRYVSFIKLSKGTQPEDLKESIHHLQQKYQDIDNMIKKRGMTFYYHLAPLQSLHLEDGNISTTLLLIGVIGLVILLMSLFNYLLLRITSIINGSKNTGIRKCLGAEKKDITVSILVDTIIHLVFALATGVIFVLAFRKSLGGLLGFPFEALVTPINAMIALGLLLLSGVVISLYSSRIIFKQSLISSIKDHQKSNRQWKMVLLFIEGMGVTFLLSTVFFIFKQYHYSSNIEKGYDVRNVYTIPTSAIDSLGVRSIEEQLRSFPEVELVSLAQVTPFDKDQSGTTIIDGSTNNYGRNPSDYYYCDEHYFNLLKVPIVEGDGFNESNCYGINALVNQTLALQLINDYGWSDGVIGKEISLSNRSKPLTIIGVFQNIRTNRFGKTFLKDEGIVISGGAWYRFSDVMLIRLKNSDSSSINKVEKLINEYTLFGDVELNSAESAVKNLFNDIQNLGHYTIFGSIIAVIIALIGIIGYAEEEVARRRKEIAIRKVNGATFWDILMLFITRYLKVGIPSTLLGLALAFIAIRKWVQTLQDQITLPILAFFAIGVLVLLITCIIMAIYCYFTANQNPTKYLTEE